MLLEPIFWVLYLCTRRRAKAFPCASHFSSSGRYESIQYTILHSKASSTVIPLSNWWSEDCQHNTCPELKENAFEQNGCLLYPHLTEISNHARQREQSGRICGYFAIVCWRVASRLIRAYNKQKRKHQQGGGSRQRVKEECRFHRLEQGKVYPVWLYKNLEVQETRPHLLGFFFTPWCRIFSSWAKAGFFFSHFRNNMFVVLFSEALGCKPEREKRAHGK